MRTPFEGKTQTGGERTRFLPRASTNFYKPFLKNHFSKIKHLSVDYMQVNHHPILTGGSRSKDNYSESPQSGTIQSRSSYKVPAGVEQRNRRSRHTPGHQRCQTTDDSQTSSKASLQSGAGRTEERTSYRRSHKGSALSGLVLVSLIFPSLGVVGPERGTTSGRTGGGVPHPCLHSAQAGKRGRIRQTLHSKPQSKWFPYCSRIGTR